MTLLGQFALWAAWLIALWGGVLGLSGRWRARPELRASLTGSVYAVFACLVLASLALWYGLVTHDFNIEYVASYTSRTLPDYFLFSAFWAGQKGSLLLWAVVLSLFAALAQFLTSRRHVALLPYVAKAQADDLDVVRFPVGTENQRSIINSREHPCWKDGRHIDLQHLALYHRYRNPKLFVFETSMGLAIR